jgi:hypothetical protein
MDGCSLSPYSMLTLDRATGLDLQELFFEVVVIIIYVG